MNARFNQIPRSAKFQIMAFFAFLALIDMLMVGLVLVRGSSLFWLVAGVYYTNFLLVPIVTILAAMVLRVRYRVQVSKLLFAFPLLLVSVFVYATFIEPTRLQIDRETIVTSKVGREYRLVHISDLQARTIGSYEWRVFEEVNNLKPDLVIHTGDLVQPWDLAQYREELDKAALLFKSLKATLGVYHVEGDVDLETDLTKFDLVAGTRSLNNNSDEVDGIHLLGLRLKESTQSEPVQVQEFLERTDKSRFRVIVGHSPNFIPKAAGTGVDLCLAGHTHGGQIQLPWIGALLTLSDIPRSWAYGFRQHNGTWLNISAGIGAEHAAYLPSIRFLCPPRITLITLKPERATQ